MRARRAGEWRAARNHERGVAEPLAVVLFRTTEAHVLCDGTAVRGTHRGQSGVIARPPACERRQVPVVRERGSRGPGFWDGRAKRSMKPRSLGVATDTRRSVEQRAAAVAVCEHSARLARRVK